MRVTIAAHYERGKELIEIANTDEHEETGEVLLYFLDSDGCQVTVRLTQHALEQLRRTLRSRP